MYKFHKYQGTGNDFVIINAISQPDVLTLTQVERAFICDRKFGIGCDGLIYLAASDQADFEMIYYNADGNESTMCGNGGRCIAQFAYCQKLASSKMEFVAIDGLHNAIVEKDGYIALEMRNVPEIHRDGQDYIIDTGSPHYITFQQIDTIDIVDYGRSIRYNDTYKALGINVNVAQRLTDGELHVVTYERGVEDETLSCGTGVTACAIAAIRHYRDWHDKKSIPILTKGGKLVIKCKDNQHDGFSDIYLCGPATFVFEGQIDLQ